ncbi:MAG: 4-(cytidine 5'-diphospho)-2-C-methyl-D-erythritol kinase [Bacteroidales bacterium]|nr:4-(cytidine 5'-diphospho)-2-C-methyl-D-erythritol kinase [Lachnoclostridium sp.]MCM1383980.1 4-(cytidine 5'-diphospho)-2-C-methyl-D-erythritol kinase [Lachnoclostridium sp.]MCM1464689.1 4-(cytidine 5'-diphospho)-2-C-methyl-D-erythritol kinase [Bacteroidales bacterium]
MAGYEIKAYAKINLGLDVLGKRSDGYHEVKMVMQTVDICDILSFERVKSGIVISTDSGELPTDGDNLIYRAVKFLFDRYRIEEGISIHLQKRIPIAAGMAGGSSDAAAALKGINEIFRLGCSLEELKALGVKIGADVPYCVTGKTALAEGIGEKLTMLPPMPDCLILVAKPDINVSTKYVYEHLDEREAYEHPDIDGMVRAIKEGSMEGILKRMGNVLESVTIPAHPIIGILKKRMMELGAEGSLMSGSGPTVFGIFTDEEKAQEAFLRLKEEKQAKQVFLTRNS